MNGFSVYAFSLYVVPLDIEFGWNRATTMGGFMMLQLMIGFASFLVGRVIHRWNVKWIIAAGALSMGIGFASLSLTQALWQFYLFYALVGLGSAATGVVPTSMVVSSWFKKRLGLAIGILGTGIGVGGFVMPILLGTYVLPYFGWRMGYIVSGIISTSVLIPLSLWFIKSRPEDMGLFPDNGTPSEDKHNHTSDAPGPGFQLNAALKTRAFWLILIALIIFGFANGQIFQNAVPHLQDVGFSAVVAASALSVVGIGSAIGKFGFGWLCDFIQPKFILVIGSVLQACATLILMSVTPYSHAFTLWLYAIMFGLGIGSWLPAVSMITNATFGLVAYGDIFGIYTMLLMVSNAVAPSIGGYIFDTTGSYKPALTLCLIFYALVVLCMLPAHRPNRKLAK